MYIYIYSIVLRNLIDLNGAVFQVISMSPAIVLLKNAVQQQAAAAPKPKPGCKAMMST